MTTELRDFEAAIRVKMDLHVKAFENQDPIPILTEFFAPDAIWDGQGFPRRTGRDEIAMLYDEVITIGSVGFDVISTRVNGDMGWLLADYPVTPADASVEPWVFRCLFNWERADDDWKCTACLCYPLTEIEQPE